MVTLTSEKNRTFVDISRSPEEDSVTFYVDGKATKENVCQAIGASDFQVDTEIVESIVEIFGGDGVDAAKAIINARIIAYDSSPNVNGFLYAGYPLWLDKATRVGLRLRFESEQGVGKESTTLWAGNIAISLPLAAAIAMLHAIEIYASECYDNTASHLAAIAELDDVDEILAYDYTDGYPEQLVFGV